MRPSALPGLHKTSGAVMRAFKGFSEGRKGQAWRVKLADFWLKTGMPI